MLWKKTLHMQQCMFMFCLSLCFHHNTTSMKLWYYKMYTCTTLSQVTNLATVFVASTTQTQVTLLKDEDVELYQFYS